MFEADKTWLCKQPGMNTWPKGCRGLVMTLSQWIADYSEPLCEESVTRSDANYGKYLSRLWMCWSHHWNQGRQRSGGTIDGASVASRIQSGRGYTGGGRLGGDPLRDVVLAVAMVAKEDLAAKQFLKEYAGYCRSVGSRISTNADDWWDEFIDCLAGYSGGDRKPDLDSFSGRCGLKNWLGRAVNRFVLRHRHAGRSLGGRSVNPLEEDAPIATVSGPEEPAVGREATLLIQKALTQVPPEDRLLILAVFIDKTKKKDIAAQLGVHPGQVTRRIQRALDRLRDVLVGIACDGEGSPGLVDLRDFGRRLVDELEASIPDNERGASNDNTDAVGTHETTAPELGETDQ